MSGDVGLSGTAFHALTSGEMQSGGHLRIDGMINAQGQGLGEGQMGLDMGLSMIDPAIQTDPFGTSPNQLDLTALLNDPNFLSAFTSWNATQQPSLSTQLLFGNNLEVNTAPTPAQQTRSGRISRPPVIPPSYPSMSTLNPAGQMGLTVNLNQASTLLPSGNGYQHGQQVHIGSGLRYSVNSNGETSDHQGDIVSGQKTPRRGRKRNISELSGTQEEDFARFDVDDDALPEDDTRPLAIPGKRGRKALPEVEQIARRRERNKRAALQSRNKKKEFMGDLAERVKEREDAFDAAEERCRELEARVEQLSRIIQSAGLRLPDTPNQPSLPHPYLQRSNPSPPTETPATITSVGDTPIPSLEMFLNIDDDENDGDFLPQSSPRPVSDSEPSDNEAEAEADATGAGTGTKRILSRSKKGKRRIQEEDEEFVDPEVWDEDLFLPIEDVPIPPPPPRLSKDTMQSMGVGSKEELGKAISEMLVAGKEGMTAETLEQMRGLLRLMGKKGVLSKPVDG